MTPSAGLIHPPRPLPAWFERWAFFRYGLRSGPTGAPNLGTPENAWAWSLLAAFGRWHHWRALGSPKPRPENVWGRSGVPVPAWAFRLEKAWRIAHPVPAPPPPPPVVLVPSIPAIFNLPAAWVNVNQNGPAGAWASYAAGAYKVGIFHALHGATDLDDTFPDAVAGARAAGVQPMGWQWGGDPDSEGRRTLPPASPEAEAEAGARLAVEHSLAGWWMNGEKQYEGGTPDARGLRLSGRYVARFKEIAPDIPLGWTPEPRLDLDHWFFQRMGVAYGPQAYPFENGWSVDDCMSVATSLFGYRAENVHPLVQEHETNGARPDPAQYVTDARAAGVRSLVLYPADQALAVPQDWTTIASL